jgi:uncharacterized protein
MAASEFLNPSDDDIRAILSRPTTVAVVGCSDKPWRDSLMIAKLLRDKGFRVIPVNPALTSEALTGVLGERVYRDLLSIPGPVEVVDVFRQPAHLPAIVEQAVRKRVRVLWCQLGVINLEAARTAQAAGIKVVMDRCPAIEYRRLFS